MSNLPPGYCDETHSWRGFAAGNAGTPPFPTEPTRAQTNAALHEAYTLAQAQSNPVPASEPAADAITDLRLQAIGSSLSTFPADFPYRTASDLGYWVCTARDLLEALKVARSQNEALTQQRDYGRDIINDMTLEAEQMDAHVKEVEQQLVGLMAKVSTLRRMATGSVPQCVNLATIDRLLAEQDGGLPQTIGVPNAWHEVTAASMFVRKDFYWIYNSAAEVIQHAQYAGKGTDEEAMWATEVGTIYNRYVTHYTGGPYKPTELPVLKPAVDVLLSKRALKALSFQQKVALCDEVGVHFALLDAVLLQPGAQQSSFTAAQFSHLMNLAAARYEVVANMQEGGEGK